MLWLRSILVGSKASVSIPNALAFGLRSTKAEHGILVPFYESLAPGLGLTKVVPKSSSGF